MTASPDFADSYEEARARFRAAAAAVGFRLDARPLPGLEPEDLTVDIAVRPGRRDARALLVSSGLHGVEGFFGSAVQHALLTDPRLLEQAEDRRLILIHALNPWGMRWRRRWNEDGVDLNRNFLAHSADHTAAHSAAYAGAPEAYRRLDPLLNPPSPPRRPDALPLIAAAQIARFGMADLAIALATGQYDYPNGLFFGGAGPARIQAILRAGLPDWLGAAERIEMFDLHTGLGRWADLKLFYDDHVPEARRAALIARYGPDLPVFRRDGRLAVPSRGLLRDWLPQIQPDRDWSVATAEFGTYKPVRMLGILRAENRAWRWGDRAGRHAWTTDALVEAFTPSDPGWRAQTIARARALCRAALA